MKETIIVDGIKLTAKYRVVYQDRWMKKNGSRWNLPNPKNAKKALSLQCLFDTAEEAKAELVKMIRKCNQGARIETTEAGGIGIDLVISADDAKESEIVNWEIQKQWRSDWEQVETSE